MATGRIGVTPTLGTRWSKAPSAGTTSLSGLDDNSVSLVYSVGYEAVYRNGVLLSRTNDYTATDGTTITLIDATIAGDIIEVFANQLVPLSDAISKGQFTAKGSLLSATAASTPAVLAVGSNDQVLTADSSTSTGLKWATAASGGMTEIASGTLSGASVSITSIPNTYKNLQLVIRNPYITSSTAFLQLRVNNSSDPTYGRNFLNSGGNTGGDGASQTKWQISDAANANLDTNSTNYASACIDILDYTTTTAQKMMRFQIQERSNTFSSTMGSGGFAGINTTAINSVQILTSASTFAGGTYILYGVK